MISVVSSGSTKLGSVNSVTKLPSVALRRPWSAKAKTTSQPIGSTISRHSDGRKQRHHRARKVEAGAGHPGCGRRQSLDGHDETSHFEEHPRV